MNNDEHNNDNTRGLPFPQTFNFGTRIHNVFRNINHAFASTHNHSGGQRTDDGLQDREDDIPALEPVSSVARAHNSHPTGSTHSSTSSAIARSASATADVDMPPSSRIGSQRDDEESMPDLRSLSDDSSGDSDAGIAAVDPLPSHQPAQPAGQDRGDGRVNNEDEPPLEPITGTRRARVDDDGDDARDRRHPSERVSVPPPPGEAAPQGATQQQPSHPPAGLFGAFFGLGPPGDGVPVGEVPPEHAQTGEDNTDPSPTDNNAIPGRPHPPRGVPIFTAGFALTIPFFGPPPGNQTGPAAGGQGPPPNLFNMDATTREELFASFAAFLQEFQVIEEGREDPERAKKLVAGLEAVPLGLVKRLERVGGAPGGHVGDASTEGSSGCAICWDTLLDGESDNFTGQQSLGDEAPRSSTSGTDTAERQNATHRSNEGMDVDAPTSASHFDANTSAPTSELPKIISLPCAHVFHASCLLPWFTRARQATCPTCRFNIDPENLTYTPPPRRAFNRGPPAQPDNAAPNLAPAGAQVPSEVPTTRTPAADPAPPSVDSPGATPDTRPATAAVPPGAVPPPPTEPAGPGFSPFTGIPGIPVLSFPAIQIPLEPNAAGPSGGDNQGIDVLTIGLDMFVSGLPPEGQEEHDRNPRGNTAGVDAANNGGAGTGAAGGNGAQNPNGLAQDLQTLIEGLLRTTRNIIPQVINAQGPAPPPVPGAPSAVGAQQPQASPEPEAGPQPPVDGTQPQPQARPATEAAGPQATPLPPGGPRTIPPFPFRPMMFRPTRPMPPRRERKTWTLPPAPGPSLRQHVEQREREQGLRCSDMSCGVGPSDEDPCPEASIPSTKQVLIHPLPTSEHENDVHASVCAHTFHPSCLVSAERVAGWGGEDKAEPLVEVSCPVCRAVGCVTREEWESGVAAF